MTLDEALAIVAKTREALLLAEEALLVLADAILTEREEKQP